MHRVLAGANLNQPRHSQQSLRTTLHRMPLVYYIRRKGAIKIGHTNNLSDRLRTLHCRWSDVVAVEFGGRDVERQRHEQFAALRVRDDGYGWEHFRETPDLAAHMAAVMADTVAKIRTQAAS